MNEIHPADLAKLRPQEPVIKYILRSAERSAGAAVFQFHQTIPVDFSYSAL